MATGCSVFFAPQPSTGTYVNQPKVNCLRGCVCVIGMPVEHILGTGANTAHVQPTTLTVGQGVGVRSEADTVVLIEVP